jgi:chromosome segregation ATPase
MTLDEWAKAGKGETWRVPTGELHNLIDEALDRISARDTELAQARAERARLERELADVMKKADMRKNALEKADEIMTRLEQERDQLRAEVDAAGRAVDSCWLIADDGNLDPMETSKQIGEVRERLFANLVKRNGGAG